MIRQRLRGIVRTTIAACIPWTILGFLTGVVFQFDLIPGFNAALGRPFPGGLLAVCTLVGGLVGVVNGLTFSGLVLATERGKSIGQLRAWRLGAWGAIATGGTLGLLFESPVAASIGAVAGAVVALASLRAARRGRTSAAEPSAVMASGG